MEIKTVVRLATMNTYMLECTMSDGSIWTCNENFKGWKCIQPSLKELTKIFNENRDAGEI